jgi:hypothetical protein
MPISPQAVARKADSKETPAEAIASASSPNAALQENTAAKPSLPVPALNVDRATIARVVEAVLSGQGITRGSGTPKAVPVASMAKETSNPSSIASEIAGRFFSSTAKPKTESAAAACASPAQPSAPSAAAPKSESPEKPAVAISPFVSENDVRRAMTRSEKIFV